MVEAAPNTEKLDEFMKDIVQAVEAGCTTAMPHLKDADPKAVDQVIQNCEELLGLVMAGHVDEWVA